MSSIVPEFAVVGRVNMGKSSVIATLLEIDDNKVVRVSPTPGETTKAQAQPVIFGGKECVRFIDTPGFSRPVEAMRAIRQLHGDGVPGRDTLRRFVEELGDEYVDERSLLEPLLDGAGVLYVVDPARRLADDFLAEMEILRWTGRPRLALMNLREGNEGPLVSEWREKLGSAFNLVRTFDAHQAKFEQRLNLMKAILEIEEEHHAALEETIELIEEEWADRLKEAAEAVQEFLAQALELRVSVRIDERDERFPRERTAKEEKLKSSYFAKLKELEKKSFGDLLKIYRHHLLTLETSTEAFADIDLESEEVWEKWGLSRSQLTLVAAATGAAGGVLVDLSFGGLLHGVPTVVGGMTGAGAAWFRGGMLPNLKLDIRDGVKFSAGESKDLVMGPPGNLNFPWILLDGILTRYHRILERAHGRRDVEVLAEQDSEDEGFTRHFPAERRKTLGKWFAACAKGNRPIGRDLESEALWAIEAAMKEVDGGGM